MKNFLLALICVGVTISSVQAVFEYDEYLNKVISKPNLETKFFKNLDHGAETQAWLDKVDETLNPSSCSSYDASFFLSLDSEGNVSGIEIEELRETEPVKFKAFVAKLASFKFPALPDELDRTVFNLDARTLYLDRKLDLARHKLQVKRSFTSFRMTGDEFVMADELELKLVKPRYLDYPVLGEELVFSKDDGSIIRTRIIDVEKDRIKVLAHQLKKEDEIYHLNLAFNVERPNKHSHETLKVVLESGFGAATLAGISGSMSSDGIMPGAFALMGMTGAALEEHEKVKSFNLVRGDSISLTRFED